MTNFVLLARIFSTVTSLPVANRDFSKGRHPLLIKALPVWTADLLPEQEVLAEKSLPVDKGDFSTGCEVLLG